MSVNFREISSKVGGVLSFLPFDKMWERVIIAKEDSDMPFFMNLMYLGEMLSKSVVAGMNAALVDDRQRNRYCIIFQLVRADGLGDWSEALDDILTGPAAQSLLSEAWVEKKELTERVVAGNWQYDSTALLHQCIKAYGLPVEELPTKVAVRKWLSLFAYFRNKSRVDYAAKFEQLIADYNASGQDVDTFFAELVSFARSLSEEEQRGVSETLSEEELAIFDLLIRPNIKLNKAERERVKQVAKELLDTLKAERLVLDWRKQQKTRASVRVAIFDALEQLPETYTKNLYDQKCEVIYQHVYEIYSGGEQTFQ
jgi:hypothetical protein